MPRYSSSRDPETSLIFAGIIIVLFAIYLGVKWVIGLF